MTIRQLLATLTCVLTISSCSSARSGQGSHGLVLLPAATGTAAVTTSAKPLAGAGECSARFEEHLLDHTTKARDEPARQYDSNGSGVAADDLDGDGRPDIVLGNLEGPLTVLWNNGGFQFITDHVADWGVRAVNLIDVDGDGKLDIILTHRGGSVTRWRNLGNRQFEFSALEGISDWAYSMAWADTDGDGDLDAATASYDAELDQTLRSSFLFSAGAGVFAYTNNGAAGFSRVRLAEKSQGLETAFVDINHDGRPELMVANDFAMEDMTFRRTASGTWERYKPFRFTSAHPMTIETGDIDNDGVEEIFTTDMRAFSSDIRVIADWMPLMSTMDKLDRPAGPQRIRNALQVPRSDGTYAEVADQANIDVAGWGWSARFGDLDNDGHQDLYVVNGMIAAEALRYLPNAEIKEPNVYFRNQGNGTFVINHEVGLDAMASGRGSVESDLDGDGRLDIVVNNMSASAAAYRNLTCDGGRAVEMKLHAPGTMNTSAIGASVTLTTSAGAKLERTIRSGGGYLSGFPTTLHFGVGADMHLVAADIRWPDGSTSHLPAPALGSITEVTRS